MKLYEYNNHITADTELLDDFIFNDLSQYSKYPSDERIANERNNVNVIECSTAEFFLELVKQYKLMEGK